MVQRSRRVSPQSKAFFHQVTGAGKPKIRRPFLGLTDAEMQTLASRLDAGIRRVVRRSSS
jgi:hypothetical protein